LNEVLESVKKARFVEMYHFILDPLWESEVCSLVEGFVIVLKKQGELVEINEKLGRCKGNLSATVEYHTVLAEGKSEEYINTTERTIK